MQSFAVGSFARMRVWACVGESVSVGRSTAEVSTLDLRLCCHGGADSDLDPVAFAFGHATEDRHDHVVGFGVRVDLSADFGYPGLDAIVGEDGEGQSELVAVEGGLWFADHDRVEAAVRVAE
ncbi:hypothetical protein ASD42_01750 [Nocardia sp. Root136]|uniref:hypothetical protein n=1 Tax=Nocardia sp. Root136 TaxID=1736458 RepID=UPI0006F6B30A|nr:hypothetical protein [Nocardia sp. Root136]KQY37356.1 hypothetical protein ASD42_01750 [Nocardia sp. Root136]